MSGVAPCKAPDVTGATLNTTVNLCHELDVARTVDLKPPEITPPTPIADSLMPAALKKAITECNGTSSCKFIGYDFDSDLATPASASRYVVDTYSTTVENSGVLVSKGKKTSGTISGVTPDATTGGSTGTVMYTADNGQTYTFQGRWKSVLVNGTSVNVYFDPANMSRGALRPEDLGFAPPVLVEPPGYELPDFQAASTTVSNLISRLPYTASIEECAKKCDETDTCTGFNFGGLDISSVCELVKDATTTREYADGMSGFRKETIPTNPSGLARQNPPGIDFGNQGVFCNDVQACNTDVSRIIQDGVGSGANDIKSFSTSDIESCAYCPVRKFNYDQGRWTVTNEIGITTSFGNRDIAIGAIQYSKDGTFADHKITITSGKFYRIGNRIVYAVTEGDGFKLFSYGSLPTAASDSYPNYEVPIFGYLHSNMRNVTVYNSEKLLAEDDKGSYGPVKDLGDHGTRNLAQKFDMMLNPPGKSYDVFSFVPVDYVTNGFRVLNSGGLAIYGDSSTKVYSRYDQDSIYVITEATLQDFLGQIKTTFAIDYPNILHNGTSYYKINSDNTADTITQAPFTSTYSSQFTFCQIYANISFDMSSFDWTSNWFTQTGKPSCDRQTKLAYVYKSGLTVPPSFVPGFWNSITQFCTNSCLAGTYASACVNSVRSCVTCSTGKYCPVGAISEQECPNGYYCPTPATKIACRPLGSTCPTGFTYVQFACEGANSSTNDRTKDLTCKAGLCPDGYGWDGTQCVKCLNGSGASGVSASGTVVGCKCTSNWSGVDCGTCGVDKYITTVTEYGISFPYCELCPEGSSTKGATNVKSCTCNDGYLWAGSPPITTGQYRTLMGLPLLTWDPNATYVTLSGPSITGIGSTTTTTTTSSNPNDQPLKSICYPCATGASCTKIVASGTFGINGGCSFTPAPGYTWANPGVDCTVKRLECTVTPAPGYTWANPGVDCSLRICSPGTYCQGGVETNCSLGSYCPGASPEGDCPAGSYCSSPSTVMACMLGQYCPARSTSPGQCPAGSYCPSPSIRNSCPGGTYSYITGLVSSTQCQTCQAGYYCPSGTVDMLTCPLTFYCPAGTSSTPLPSCPAGYYCPSSSTKNVCPAGYYCPNGTVNPYQCTTAGSYCPAGSTSAAGTACAATCSAGTYETTACTSSTNRVCSQCTVGYYCTGGTARTACITAGYYCPAGSTSATGTACAVCATNMNRVDCGGANPGTCVCKTGTVSIPPGSVTCVPAPVNGKCSVGEYVGTWTDGSTQYCWSCGITVPTGYIWDNAGVTCTTKPCPAGYYCPNSTTQTVCSTGYFCPAGSISGTKYTYTTLGCAYGTDGTTSSYDCIKPRVSSNGYFTDCKVTYPNVWAVYIGLVNNQYYCGYQKSQVCPTGKTLGTWTDGTQYCY